MRSNFTTTLRDRILHLPVILTIVGLSLVVLLQGCGECPPCPEVRTTTPSAKATSVWPPANAVDSMLHEFSQKYVMKYDLDAARCYFRQKVLAGPDTTHLQKLDSAAIVINWKKLSATMNDHFSSTPPPPECKRAIRVIYGLTAKTSPTAYYLTPFIQFLKITPDSVQDYWRIVDESTAIYGIDTDDGELHLASKKEYDDATQRYAALIHIHRAGPPAGFTQFSATSDVRHFTFHWEYQLVPLVAHNASPNFIKLTSIAEERPAVGPYPGVRHHLVAVALDSAKNEMISNNPVVAGIEYKNHGSDIGSACPPQCSTKLHFPPTGLATPVCP